jgi:high-affinity iron transporter
MLTSRPLHSATSGSNSASRLAALVALSVGGLSVTAVMIWQAFSQGGNPDPLAPHLGFNAAVLDIGVLVFREGLECILVLAAITATMGASSDDYRRPVAVGAGAAFIATLVTWWIAIGLIDDLTQKVSALNLQAATGLLAIVVLLIVMNWFFHKVYWTGWISNHHKRRRGLLSADSETNQRRLLLGLALLGFTSVYRECFEIVIFLQNLRELYGASVVLEGVVIGLLFTAAAGVLTFALHQRLPYRRLLIITGVMLLFVLLVSVGEEVNEMQLAGWIGTTQVPGLTVPGWMGTWFSIFPNWETFAGQFIALTIVMGSYVGAQYVRVWRPRRRGRRPAQVAVAPPEERTGDRGSRRAPANALA